MPVARFPDPKTATEDGLLAIGGDLHPQTLLLAYRSGIFPWPLSASPNAYPPFDKQETIPLTWFSPPERAILEFKALHLSRSLERARKKSAYRISLDEDFAQVIDRCRELRTREGTWITAGMQEAYIELHRLGIAHSVEVWRGSDLVGGIYGVDVDGAFAGESMFHLEPNTSKLALLYLVDHLRERGLSWMDIQVMTPHMKALGAEVMSRDDFLARLQQTRALRLKLFP